MLSPQRKVFAPVNCEMAFDNLTRQLYATDASIYQIEPLGVAFPRNARQASEVIQAAAEGDVPIIPRGAGTGLVGGAIGAGMILDFARYQWQIADLDLEHRTVRVGAGVVLDHLNQFLRPHRLRFGPDVATSSRATLGGMIASDSSGAHAPYYGTTADHVTELEILMHDGRIVRVGPHLDALPRQRELVDTLVEFHSLKIQETFPPGLVKRWPGYGLARCLREPRNLLHVLAGSEGTLAAILSAEVRVVPLPEETGLGLLFFDSVAEAMQATVELLDLQPAAVEHLDRLLLDQTRGQLEFQAARDLLELDAQPCEALLIVEFFDEVEDRLAELARRAMARRHQLVRQLREMNLVWELRKAGLNLLTSRKGDAKPVTGIEDTAVPPRRLPEYVAALQGLLQRRGLEASFYGHAAAGLLHVRPILDLHSSAAVKTFRELATDVAALVREFKGSLAAEHGVGIARTEFLAGQLGEDLLGVMREIKASFDPQNLFNPGKIVGDGRYRFDHHLRFAPDQPLSLSFAPMLAFAARDGSFVRNLEQCNGCGACRKTTPGMCPTFIATGDELMSTRGRANLIRAVLEQRGLEGRDPLRAEELEAALSNCLGCKACNVECPSNVNLTLLKAELLHARIRRDGPGLRERALSHVDRLGRLGCVMPELVNVLLDTGPVRHLLGRLLGITAQRPLPAFARERFDHWFARRAGSSRAPRGRVVLWDDTFVRYHEPHIGVAAVKVLEAAGFAVALPTGRQCCGRPAFSQGHLEVVRRLGTHNLALLNRDVDNAPIVFLEPSCYSMFVEDYRELKLPGWERVARRCVLFEQLLADLLRREPGALTFPRHGGRVVIHAHCHVKALMAPGFLAELAEWLPERTVTLLDTGCCGMAGAFGMLVDKYELSLKVAEPLIQHIRAQPFGTVVVASGTSCRHQIDHLAPVRARHMAELLADALA